MQLLPTEETLVTSNEDKVVLTTHRIKMTDKEWGSSYSIFIFLEDISSIEVRYRSNVVFLILGCLGILSGIFISQTYSGSNINVGLIAGIVFLILWCISRKHVISISPNGGKTLNFEIGNMAGADVDHFIDNLQTAKLKRVNNLHKV